jgi:hypothetical protein
MKRSGFITVLALCTAFTVFAQPQVTSTFKLGDVETHTPVSGYAGAWVELGSNLNNQVLYGITWGEKTDDPCGLQANTLDINTLTPFLDPKAMPRKPQVNNSVYGRFDIVENKHAPYIDRMGKHQFAKQIKLDCNGNMKSVSSIANDKSVYKISVCTTDKKKSSDNKLKGIKVWTRSLVYKPYNPGKPPQLIDEPTPQFAYHHPHCDQWHKPVACGDGEVATTIRVHHNDTGHRDWITGLSLVCRKVLVDHPISHAVPTS